jgi:hypothetical protein
MIQIRIPMRIQMQEKIKNESIADKNSGNIARYFIWIIYKKSSGLVFSFVCKRLEDD